MDGNGQTAQSEISNLKSEIELVWARRAAQLAQAIIDQDQSEQIELVLVRLGREMYGLEAQYIFDIRPLERVTRVPRAPEWVTGVINVRGRILSVCDLQRFLGLPRARRLDTLHRIVVETDAMEVALLIDEVLAVEALPVDQIQDASGTVRGIRPEYIRGIIERGRNGDENGDKNASEQKPGSNHASENGRAGDDRQADASLLVILDLPALLADERLVVQEEIT